MFNIIPIILPWITGVFGNDTSELTGYVVGGDYTTIEVMPHMAYLRMVCIKKYICGANILNEKFLITAAHCVEGCDLHRDTITARIGSEDKLAGKSYKASKYIIPSKFNREFIEDDISVVMLFGTIRFGNNAKRLAIVASHNYMEGEVAGWGMTNEVNKTFDRMLKNVHQRIWSQPDCEAVISYLPEGVFCAGEENSTDFVSAGDSGSGLVVGGYILAGVVSFKEPESSVSLVVYTDISRHYHWIIKTITSLLKTC